jgi:cytochrome P450
MGSRIQIEDFKDGFDPFTALLTIGGEGNITNPLDELGRLRRLGPVHEGDLHEHFGAARQVVLGENSRAFMVLSHEACSEVLGNADDYSNSIYELHVGITFGRSITTMDAPEHNKYRKLFQAAFTPKMLAALKPRFQSVIDRLIDGFKDKHQADLVHEFAVHFPFQFICDLMDLPMEDRPVFHRLAHGQTCVMFDPEHGREAARLLGNYLTPLIEQRRAMNSETDFISLLANAEVDGERLPDDVILGFFRQLMNAGGDTSYHGFSNILASLFMHPEQLEAIRKDRNLIQRAIEEGLRLGAPITSLDRTPSRDVVLGGVSIPKGSTVRVCIAVANRDEKVWEEADRFNIFREPKRHMAFGYGAHVCIGQHLARMELQTALNSLLDRLPNLRLNPDLPAPTVRGLTFRGADAVHVKWD